MQTRRSHASRFGTNTGGAIEIPQHHRRYPSPSASRPAFTTNTKGNGRAASTTPIKRTESRGRLVPNMYSSRVGAEVGPAEYDGASHMVATPRGNRTVSTTPRGGLVATPRGGRRNSSTNASQVKSYSSVVHGPEGKVARGGLVSLYHPTTQLAAATANQSAGALSVISSSSAAAVLSLESYVAEVMGVRMRSMTDLKRRLDDLTSIHQREEVAFREQMGELLAQSEQVRSAHESTEEHFSKLLQKEKAERIRAVQLMQRFRAEGSAVMAELKDALATAQGKWQEEVERNAKLTAQLRRQQDGGHGGPSSDLEGKVSTLTSLLEEEDAIIVELQQRNRLLEQRATEALAERDRLASTVAAMNQSANAVDAEYNALLNQLANRPQSAPTANDQKLQLLNQFAVSVVTKLKAEQRQRLLTEEQATKVVEAQELMIKKLEARLKEAENNSASMTGSFAVGGNMLRQPPPPVVVPAFPPIPFHQPQFTPKSHREPEQAPSKPFAESDDLRRSEQLKEFLSQIQRTPSSGLNTGAGKAALSRGTPPTTQSKLEMYRSSPRRAVAHADPLYAELASVDHQPDSREVSLEADLQRRLATVTADFHESIQSWSSALHARPYPGSSTVEKEPLVSSGDDNDGGTGDGNEVDEEDDADFEPEEPPHHQQYNNNNNDENYQYHPTGPDTRQGAGGDDEQFLPTENLLSYQEKRKEIDLDFDDDGEVFGP